MKEKTNSIMSYLSAGFFVLLVVVVLLSVNDDGGIKVKDINESFASQEERPQTGYMAPDFSLNDINGKKVELSEIRGSVVLLNIWATWCGPCLAEMPSLEKLYKRFDPEKFKILAVSVDKQGLKVVDPFVKGLGLTFPILIDSNDLITRKYHIFSLPETLIIDKQGIIVLKVSGARNWSSKESIDAIEYLISK